ncbi:MAG: PEP-CTERM sorting domain-containing protein [Pirellulales bacterium]
MFTGFAAEARAMPFNLTFSLSNPDVFSGAQRAILDTAIADAEALWEAKITGYQPGISLSGINITVTGNYSGLASASVSGFSNQGGFQLATAGRIMVNVDELENFADWNGTGLNVVDELLAHEIGHVLGIGTLWSANGLYVYGTGRYTGAAGLAAYRREFDAAAAFVPVELAGSPGTANSHWDQLMRSSVQEGLPSDPYSISPLLGIEDQFGRDLALELMTGAIDPDYGEPFLSRFTVRSLRDLGFTVVPEPTAASMLALAAAAATLRRRRR